MENAQNENAEDRNDEGTEIQKDPADVTPRGNPEVDEDALKESEEKLGDVGAN